MDFNFDNPPEVQSPDTRIDIAPESESESVVGDWSDDVEGILREVNHNCRIMSDHHKKAYLLLTGQLIYFRLPLICLSSANSILAIGLSSFVTSQTVVSGINSVISLACAIISSVELFLQIQKRSESELLSHREYYLLSVKISSMLKIDRKRRQAEGLIFMNSVLGDYTALFESSNVDKHDMIDRLVVIHHHDAMTLPATPTMSPTSSALFKRTFTS